MTADTSYTAYLAAKRSGWFVLQGFVNASVSMKPADIAARDSLTVAEVKQMRLTFERLSPCAQTAIDAALPLDMLHLLSKKFGAIKNGGKNLLEQMMKAVAGKSVREAEFVLEDIVKQHYVPRPRHDRWNFAKNPDLDGMVFFNGKMKEATARQLQTEAEPFVKGMMENDGVRYDQALGTFMMRRLLNPTTPSQAPDSGLPPALQPLIILSSDPNIDIARGHLNMLNGAAVPLAEAIDARLAGTGYVACTRQDEAGVVHLDAIVPIVATRYSTETHRIGVVLENLVCAHPDCDLPAVTCQAHHIKSVAYHHGETSWNNLTAACAPHNAHNDDNPNAPPKNGRLERGPDGWIGHRRRPDEELRYNPNPKFREGYRGTTEAINANFRP